jgi:membrane-associated phospholipid phosphatase
MNANKIANKLCEYGPYLMLVMSLPFIWTKKMLLNYTLIGLCLSVIINATLKFIFKCPRPNTERGSFLAVVKNTSYIDNWMQDPFGFPSGHSQNGVFIAAFMYNAFGLQPTTILLIVYSMIIMWQRVYKRKHYIYQVIGGAIVGIALATGVYHAYKTHLVGHIMHKLDDWSMLRM